MANTSISIPSLWGGVSRQAPAIRHENQVEEATNVLLSIKEGATKRPGSEMLFAITGLTADDAYRIHPIHRDDAEKYLMIYGDSTIRLFGLDGTEYTVIIDPVAQAYIDAHDADADELHPTTIADYTLLANSLVNTGAIDAPYYEVAQEHDDYEAMIASTPDADTYHRTLAAGVLEPKGYWKYDPGKGTFATIVFDEVTGDEGGPIGYDGSTRNPGGFEIGMYRLPLVLTAGAWDYSEMNLTEADAFKDYTWREGDQIHIDGGTGIVAGWYTIASKTDDDTIVLETAPKAGDAADVTSVGIGVYCDLTDKFDVSDKTISSMHDIAEEFQHLLRDAGATDALCSWTKTGDGKGYMSITSPWRGSGVTFAATVAPATNYDFTAAGKLFSGQAGEYTITAGIGSPSADTLPVADRWTRQPRARDEKSAPDPAKMPVKIVRQIPTDLDYAALVISDNPYAYWRLGEAGHGGAGSGDGLTGKYYNNSDLTDLALTRIDSQVDFDWGTGSPDASVNADTFSIEWTGVIEAKYTENYTFKTITDNGVKLWINDVLVIDDWTIKNGKIGRAHV